MWTERRKRIGPIAARKKAAAPTSEKNRSAAPAGQKWQSIPLGQAPARQNTMKPGGFLDGGTAGKEEHHVN